MKTMTQNTIKNILKAYNLTIKNLQAVSQEGATTRIYTNALRGPIVVQEGKRGRLALELGIPWYNHEKKYIKVEE